MKKTVVHKDSYYDSVFLMLINRDVKALPGVEEAVVAMGTATNLELLADMGFTDLESAGPNDLIIAAEGESDQVLADAEQAVSRMLRARGGGAQGEEYRPATLAAALKVMPDANIALISLPGEFAAREARRALLSGLHVMLFSDNVSLQEEIRLKTLARERGLLMMGPDCGTAIINGKPLCFANVVRRGDIGVVGASGTGLQEVTCAIERFGGGVSQAIGTGGRDLKDERVGGITMIMGIEALARDPRTRVIAVISKPPAAAVARKVVAALQAAGKPGVVHFIGLARGADEGQVHYAGNLEETAGMAVALAAGKPYEERVFTVPVQRIDALIEQETRGMAPGQKYLRGLFTGGTLADEALILLDELLGGVYSNNQLRPELVPSDPHVSREHTIVDLGDDVFTVGRPHPMIDPSTREERIRREMGDPQVAVMLLDMVLGYGSHPDPSGAIAGSLREAKARFAASGGFLSIIASITVSAGDIQDVDSQRRTLEAAGAVVMPSNYQAAMLAFRIMEKVATR